MKITHLTSLHPVDDNRIFKMCRSLVGTGRAISYVVPAEEDRVVAGVFIKAVPRARSRFRRMIGTTWRVYRRALNERADIYQFHDPELIPIGLALQLFHGRKVVYDVHENVPEQILTKTYIPVRLRKLIAAGFDRLERAASRRFSAVVTANEDLNGRLESRVRHLLTIHNYADNEEFSNLPLTNDSRYRSGIVFHSAASERTSYSAVLRAFEVVPKALHATLIATAVTAAEEQLANEMTRRHPDVPVQLTGVLAREEFVQALSQCAVSIVLYADECNHSGIRANRLFESLSAAAPVIVPDFPEWRAYVESIQCGICVDPKDPLSIAEALQYLLTHPAEAAAMGARGWRASQERFNWSVERDRLLDLYDNLLDVTRDAPEVVVTTARG